MFMEIDEGYLDHPKTLDLCGRLQDSRAALYPIRLWQWACRSAKSGKLGKISAWAIEKAIDYEAKDGRCFEAMVGAGFIDRDADGNCEIHDWMKHTGGAIKRMDEAAEKKKLYRAHRDKKCGPSCEWCRTVPGQSQDSPKDIPGTSEGQTDTVQSSQDQSSPVQTRQERRDPDLTRAPGLAPIQATGGKPTPRHVAIRFGAIRGEVCGSKKVFWQPTQAAIDKITHWLGEMPDDGTPDIEPAIRLACEKTRDGADGWTNASLADPNFLLGAFVAKWPALREELHGCAPIVANREPRQRQRTPIAD